MAAIKRFFEKKKLDLKFKKYGDGHKLTDDTRSKDAVPKSSGQSVRPVMSDSAQRAGEAALVRMSQPDKKAGGAQKRAVRAELLAEMEAMEAAQKRAANSKEVVLDCKHVERIKYTCPMIGDEVLPKEEMEARIHEYLLGQLAEVPEMASALMIHTLNKDREAVKVCIETLCKYLDNIIADPAEEKFRKIRIQNKPFQERVLKLQGAEEFIQSIGFTQKTLLFQEVECAFYVLSDEKTVDDLIAAKQLLLDAEPIKPELHRGLRVLDGNIPGLVLLHTDLPDEFFAVSKDELQREMNIRREAVENLGMLRTKAMRERDERRELRKYRFALIRVRFPDNTILQGTFRAQERLSSVLDYVRAALVDEWLPFGLCGPTGHKLVGDDDEQRTIAELGLAPAAIVTFSVDESVLGEMAVARGVSKLAFIKPEIMALKETKF